MEQNKHKKTGDKRQKHSGEGKTTKGKRMVSGMASQMKHKGSRSAQEQPQQHRRQKGEVRIIGQVREIHDQSEWNDRSSHTDVNQWGDCATEEAREIAPARAPDRSVDRIE